MKNTLTLIFLSCLFLQCSIDRTTLPLSNIEIETLEEFKSLAPENRVQISDNNETGQQFWLALTVVTKENKTPLINQRIHLYHASAKGEYEPSNPNDESTARLNGAALTDEDGRIFVQTILPGDYGTSSDNRHIHTSVENARPVAYDIHFKQYSGFMMNRFISGSDQHFIADLKLTKDSILVALVTIEAKNHSLQPH